jgi:hypothetical protein
MHLRATTVDCSEQQQLVVCFESRPHSLLLEGSVL